MSWLGRIVGGTLAVLSLGSCSKPERAAKIEALHFPVVILFGNASTLLCHQPEELKTMHSNYLTLNSETPFLIDSEFNIYSLDHLRSVHSGLWLMANPSGATEVTFELKAQSSGREQTRELLARHLQKQTWRDDLEPRQRALSRGQTWTEMVRLIQPGND